VFGRRSLAINAQIQSLGLRAPFQSLGQRAPFESGNGNTKRIWDFESKKYVVPTTIHDQLEFFPRQAACLKCLSMFNHDIEATLQSLQSSSAAVRARLSTVQCLNLVRARHPVLFGFVP